MDNSGKYKVSGSIAASPAAYLNQKGEYPHKIQMTGLPKSSNFQQAAALAAKDANGISGGGGSTNTGSNNPGVNTKKGGGQSNAQQHRNHHPF
jgi:hypothetical protein